MNKIQKLHIISIILILILSACGDPLVIPSSTLTELDAEKVMQPISYLSNSVSEVSTLSFSFLLTEDEQAEVKSYKWEILNTFGEKIVSSTEKQMQISGGLYPDDYRVVLTLTDKENYSRSFTKIFTVSAIILNSELVLDGLASSDDTGESDSDTITNKNHSLQFSGTAPAGSSVKLKIENVATASSYQFDAEVGNDGNIVVITSGTEIIPDGTYDVYLIDNESGGNVTNITIDTKAPVLEWMNQDSNVTIEYRGITTLYEAVRADESVTDYVFSGGLNTSIAGIQQLSVSASDIAGNRSEEISRTLTINPPSGELAQDGHFSGGTDINLSSTWMLSAAGFEQYIISSNNKWSSDYTSETGGTITLPLDTVENEIYEGINKINVAASGDDPVEYYLKIHGRQKTGLTNPDLARVRGSVTQTIEVMKDVTYQATVLSTFDNNSNVNHHSWNSLVVQSRDSELSFTEGNQDLYPQEPDPASGISSLPALHQTRISRICSGPDADGRPADDNSPIVNDNTMTKITLYFTPDKDGTVYVSLMKSGVWDDSTVENGSSLFDQLSVQPFDWPKVP